MENKIVVGKNSTNAKVWSDFLLHTFFMDFSLK